MWEDYDWRNEPPQKLNANPVKDTLIPIILDYATTVGQTQSKNELAAWTISTLAKNLFLYSVMSGDAVAIRRLLEAGCDVDAFDRWGRSALHLVQSDEIAEVLIEFSPEHRVLDCVMRTPLYYAVSRNLCGTVRWLLEHGAEVSHMDAYGQTPLHIAACAGRTEIASILIAAGADPTVRDDSGMTPRDIFKNERGHVPDFFDNPELLQPIKFGGTLFAPNDIVTSNIHFM